MKIFDNNDVNTGRQVEFDIAKAVCIIGMVVVHAYEITALSTCVLNYTFTVVLNFLFGAGTFMLCMGMGIVYGKNNPGYLIKRGAIIILIGFALNLVRSGLPRLVMYFADPSGENLNLFKYALLNIDILPFAGLALILFGIAKKLRLSDGVIGAAAVLLSASGTFLRGKNLGSFEMNQLAGLFFGTNFPGRETTTCFPLLNWFIFVAAGYLFAKVLRKCRCKGMLYGIVSPIAAAAVTVYMIAAIPERAGMMSGDMNLYYHIGTSDALIVICAALAAIGLYYALSRVMSKKLIAAAAYLSKAINIIYCTHWVLIIWTWYPLYYSLNIKGFNDLFVFIYAALIMALSLIFAAYYLSVKHGRVKHGSK